MASPRSPRAKDRDRIPSSPARSPSAQQPRRFFIEDSYDSDRSRQPPQPSASSDRRGQSSANAVYSPRSRDADFDSLRDNDPSSPVSPPLSPPPVERERSATTSSRSPSLHTQPGRDDKSGRSKDRDKEKKKSKPVAAAASKLLGLSLGRKKERGGDKDKGKGEGDGPMSPTSQAEDSDHRDHAHESYYGLLSEPEDSQPSPQLPLVPSPRGLPGPSQRRTDGDYDINRERSSRDRDDVARDRRRYTDEDEEEAQKLAALKQRELERQRAAALLSGKSEPPRKGPSGRPSTSDSEGKRRDRDRREAGEDRERDRDRNRVREKERAADKDSRPTTAESDERRRDRQPAGRDARRDNKSGDRDDTRQQDSSKSASNDRAPAQSSGKTAAQLIRERYELEQEQRNRARLEKDEMRAQEQSNYRDRANSFDSEDSGVQGAKALPDIPPPSPSPFSASTKSDTGRRGSRRNEDKDRSRKSPRYEDDIDEVTAANTAINGRTSRSPRMAVSDDDFKRRLDSDERRGRARSASVDSRDVAADGSSRHTSSESEGRNRPSDGRASSPNRQTSARSEGRTRHDERSGRSHTSETPSASPQTPASPFSKSSSQWATRLRSDSDDRPSNGEITPSRSLTPGRRTTQTVSLLVSENVPVLRKDSDGDRDGVKKSEDVSERARPRTNSSGSSSSVNERALNYAPHISSQRSRTESMSSQTNPIQFSSSSGPSEQGRGEPRNHQASESGHESGMEEIASARQSLITPISGADNHESRARARKDRPRTRSSSLSQDVRPIFDMRPSSTTSNINLTSSFDNARSLRKIETSGAYQPRGTSASGPSSPSGMDEDQEEMLGLTAASFMLNAKPENASSSMPSPAGVAPRVEGVGMRSTSDGDPPPARAPVLLNSIISSDRESVMSLAADEKHIFSGSQVRDVHVWDISSYQLKTRMRGHTGSVHCLELAKDRNCLFSSSGDNTIRVWSTTSFRCLYVLHAPHDNVGDILSLAWAPSQSTLFAGCQDTSIMWISIPADDIGGRAARSASRSNGSEYNSGTQSMAMVQHGDPDGASHSSLSGSTPPARPPNRFFDSLSSAQQMARALSKAQTVGRIGPGLARSNSGSSLPLEVSEDITNGELTSALRASGEEHLQISPDCIYSYAHFGYVYCLLSSMSPGRLRGPTLISGSGDETVKVWAITNSTISPLATLTGKDDAAVLALAIRDGTVFAGYQGGEIKVWDLETYTCVRTLTAHKADVLTITAIGDELFSGSADGHLQRWSRTLFNEARWQAHEGIILSSAAASQKGDGHIIRRLITGASDDTIKVWDISQDTENAAAGNPEGQMFHLLKQWISFRSISDDLHREECRQAALFLKKTLTGLGASASLLPGEPGRNPLVMAKFEGQRPPDGMRKKRVLFYGHYDVVKSSGQEWKTDPFKLTGINGWLYGRGVSDNKGPTLAVACAAANLLADKELFVDIILLIEGEEESGSAGFKDAVRRHRQLFGDIDVVLVSNSYWIGEEIPCMNFGLRGVIRATVEVVSNQPDLHSGMQGGVVHEPLVDLVRVLSGLVDAEGNVKLSRFYDNVSDMAAPEEALYDLIIERCKGKQEADLDLAAHSHIADTRQSLIRRWREPALSVHKIDVSGAHATIIPSRAKASVSIRTVPNQSLKEITDSLHRHIHTSFGKLRSRNALEVRITHVADWWLGDPSSPYSRAFVKSIMAEWGIPPLWIREGGSIPSIPFLEREFKARTVQFPMGQSSDCAHLANERIRVQNLERGRKVVKRWLSALPALITPPSSQVGSPGA